VPRPCACNDVALAYTVLCTAHLTWSDALVLNPSTPTLHLEDAARAATAEPALILGPREAC
jgi:hypothetical protein